MRAGIHPLVLFTVPLALSPVVLVAASPSLLAAVTLGALLGSGLGGWRLVLRTGLLALTVLTLVAAGTVLWIGAERGVVLGARMAALTVMVVVPFSLIDWRVLADSAIEYLHLPYPLVDMVAMAHRFVALMRREAQEMTTRLRLETAGSPLLWMRRSPRIVVPLLVAVLRHADMTALALESRGFATQPRRTTHRARPVRVRDWCVAAACGVVFAAATSLM